MKSIFLILILFISQKALAENRITFEDFLKAATSQNLTLKIESAKSKAAESNSSGITLPPPTVGLMKMTEKESGSSANGFEVEQMIPFPGRIAKDHSARRFEAQAQEEMRKGIEAETFAKAKILYLDLWASQQRKQALLSRRQAIEEHLKLSRAATRSDSFLKIHTLKAESDLDLLENDILSADQEIREKESIAGEFLNVDVRSFHPVLTEPPLTELPTSVEDRNSHQLEASRLTLESFKAREDEGKLAWFPDFYLRYRETGGTQMMPRYSEAMVGISLPFIFPWQSSRDSEKNSFQRQQSELEFEKEKIRINSDKYTLSSRAQSLRQQLDNLNRKVLPKAERRMKLIHNIAPRDMESLQDHREAMEAFPELKLKSLDLRMQYENAAAELLKYTWSSK
jgi:outer membrane protein TolC